MPRRMVPIMEDVNINNDEIIENEINDSQSRYGYSNLWIWILLILAFFLIFGGFHY